MNKVITKVIAKGTKYALAGATGYEVAGIVEEAMKVTSTTPPPPPPVPQIVQSTDQTIVILLVSILALLLLFIFYTMASKIKSRIAVKAVEQFRTDIGMQV